MAVFFTTDDEKMVRKMFQILEEFELGDGPPIDTLEEFRAYWAGRGVNLEAS